MFSKKFFCINRHLAKYYSSHDSPKICIVGSGPGGFYAAQHLLKVLPNAIIDMYEKLPVPFGLVRYGVAPDHPEVKNVINSFSKIASSKNFNFIGNVSLGTDINFKDLQTAYHGIILAYGCSEEKKLGIKGENKIISARRIVGWYNGLPEDKNLNINLDCEELIIIGQGNVAIDVARIILTPVDLLAKTDITAYALETLCKSKVKKVYLVGRRGPLHVAFTIKEFREMTNLPGVCTLIKQSDLLGLEDIIPTLPRPRKRLTELLLKTCQSEQRGDKTFCPLFLLNPDEVIFDDKVKGIKFKRNVIKDNLKGIIETTDTIEKISCNMCISSVGYRGVSIDPDIPFDDVDGRVNSQLGIYGSGWISTGPVGVILSTMNDAFQQGALLAQDIQSNKINVEEKKPGYDLIKKILINKGLRVVSFEGWRKIDKEEVVRGEKVGKPREKIVDIEEMLEIGGQ